MDATDAPVGNCGSGAADAFDPVEIEAVRRNLHATEALLKRMPEQLVILLL